MGKAIEALAIQRAHEVCAVIDKADYNSDEISMADVAIEFTQPDAAVQNIQKCFEAGIPVVVGTTGWNEHYIRVARQAIENGNGLFTASNFSVGVNIFFQLNQQLAKIMNAFPDYSVSMNETHHIHKKDHPSGTAVTLAEDIIAELDRKNGYLGQLYGQVGEVSPLDLPIVSKRENEVPGFHEINYTSEIDEIKISHNAFNRLGFAQGALLAAEWMQGRKGVYGMKDLLKFDQ